MAIGDDWTIDYTIKVIRNKYAWGQGGSSTVYTVNQLYSWLMDTFDEQGAMDDDIPMTAQTPNAYTMVNNWFIDDESVKYLKNGAITQTRDDAKIAMITMSATGYTNCVFTDITKQVQDDGVEIGRLLSYDNTRRVWWVRTSSTVADGSTMTITGGTGAGTSAAFDNTGDDLFTNVYTLGTIETGTDIYIYQAGSKISAWWPTGHIDILIKVKEFGTEIDGAVVTVYARVYTDLYDFYEIDLTAGGRNAVPLATSNDLDNQTAAATILNLLDTIKIMFVNGTLPYDSNSGENPVEHAVVHGTLSHATAFILNAPPGTSGTFTLANINGTFQSGEGLEILREVKFDAQTALFKTIPQTISATSGGSGTLRRVVQDPQGTGTEGILYLSNVTGTFADNDTLTGSSDGSATQNGAISSANTFNGTTTATASFACTINKDLDNGNGPQPYNVVIDLNGETVANLYEFVKAFCRQTSTLQTYPTNGTNTIYAYNGEFYQRAVTTYAQLKKASPFGTFAGGKFFGARGIWIENMFGEDVEKFQLIDANNTTQNPPVSSTLRVVSMIASTDRVLVAESRGSGSTDVKRDQYTCTVQSGARSYVEVSGSIADDAPSTGTIHVIQDYGTPTETETILTYTGIDRSGANHRFLVDNSLSLDTDDRVYNPYIDTLADVNGQAEVSVKYSGTTKYIVTRVRKAGYIPFQVAGSFGSGLTVITAIRTVDGIYQA